MYMENAKILLNFISSISWQIIFITFMFLFRKNIKELFSSITKGEMFGFKFEREALKNIENKIQSVEVKVEEVKEEIVNAEEEREITEKLLNEANTSEDTMLAVTVNASRNENCKYSIYYDSVFRNHKSPFSFIGLYEDKQIFAIGKIEKMVYCDYDANVKGKLVSTTNLSIDTLTLDERERLVSIIENTKYYDLRKGHKFFIVDKFYDTYYRKKSPSPLRFKKYFLLNEITGFTKQSSTKEIAMLLDGKEWE